MSALASPSASSAFPENFLTPPCLGVVGSYLSLDQEPLEALLGGALSSYLSEWHKTLAALPEDSLCKRIFNQYKDLPHTQQQIAKKTMQAVHEWIVKGRTLLPLKERESFHIHSSMQDFPYDFKILNRIGERISETRAKSLIDFFQSPWIIHQIPAADGEQPIREFLKEIQNLPVTEQAERIEKWINAHKQRLSEVVFDPALLTVIPPQAFILRRLPPQSFTAMHIRVIAAGHYEAIEAYLQCRLQGIPAPQVPSIIAEIAGLVLKAGHREEALQLLKAIPPTAVAEGEALKGAVRSGCLELVRKFLQNKEISPEAVDAAFSRYSVNQEITKELLEQRSIGKAAREKALDWAVSANQPERLKALLEYGNLSSAICAQALLAAYLDSASPEIIEALSQRTNQGDKLVSSFGFLEAYVRRHPMKSLFIGALGLGAIVFREAIEAHLRTYFSE